ncbi:hypothetical protein M9H77_06701 [Catharanthus roseus]|uniref:Uncharacterized protein n=1 Tax=Catharanthus roseus TaxID=4058 RepID=A0ACC0BSU6_CATRO|nr:hypothetical protein M9H77_06701 [Catharanthus roseus]
MELYTLRLSFEEDKYASIARSLCGVNRDIANQLELYPNTTYEDMCHLATKIENQRKRVGFSKTNLPSSRSMVPKPQESTYKSCPKKEDTPKVAFKYRSKHKVEKKGTLITNPTRCFKCNGFWSLLTNVASTYLLENFRFWSVFICLFPFHRFYFWRVPRQE